MTAAIATLTTLEVGGVPTRLIRATSREGLIRAATDAFADERWLIIGGGSNLLVSDEPFEGTVVHVATEGIDATAASGDVRVRVAAGQQWDSFVAHTVARGWAGVEALSGIPGTVGAAPIQNIGAYGQEVAETISRVEFFDASTGAVEWLPPEELAFGYRSSVFKAADEEPAPRRNGVILSVEFLLTESSGQSRPLASTQLVAALDTDMGATVPLADVRSQVLRLRALKGMVWDAHDPDTHSAGSFFINPIVSSRAAAQLPPQAPRWPVDRSEPAIVIPLGELAHYAHVVSAPIDGADSRVKLSAAWLIEQSGIPKGFSLGHSRAAVSSKHALALTNRGGATAEEIAQLARFIQSRVQAEFGIWLHPEPRCIDLEL